MYASFFGLKRACSMHQDLATCSRANATQALAHLLYPGWAGGGLLLTGEIGAGKTHGVPLLLEQIPPLQRGLFSAPS